MKKRILRSMACGVTMLMLSLQLFLGVAVVQAANGYGAEPVQSAREDLDYDYLAQATGLTQAQVKGMVEAFSALLAGTSAQYDVSALGIVVDASLSENMWLLLDAAGLVQPYAYHCTKWAFSWSKYASNNVMVSVSLKSGEQLTSDEIAARAKELEAAVEEVFAVMPSGMGQVDCAVWVHDYLIKNFEYDQANLNAGTLPLRAHTAYGLMIDKKGVCDGYTGAYNMILGLCGIDSISISGNANGAHAWSQVKLESQWYEADVTWDDPLSDVKGKTVYTHLFLTDAELRGKNHAWTGGNICNSTLFSNWFARNVSNMNYYDGLWYYMNPGGEFVRSDIWGNHAEVLKKDVQTATLYNGRIFYFKDLALYAENVDGTGTVKLMEDKDVELAEKLGNYVAEAVLMNAVNGNVMTYQIRDWHVTENVNGSYSLQSRILSRTFELPLEYAEPYAAPDRVAGDINGDGEINSSDAVALMQYLAEMDVTISRKNADVNNDGEVNSSDAVLLMQYLAEMDVELQ